MTTALDAVNSKPIRESGQKEESTRRLICWLSLFSFGTGFVTLGLIDHIRKGTNQEWLFDLPVLLSCLVFARSYALRLLRRG